MEAGTKVILTQEYNGYPIGTVAIYLYSRNDSGTWAAIVASDDERLAYEMKAFSVSTIKKLVERNQNNLSLLECSLTTFRPTEQILTTLNDLENEIKAHQQALKDKIGLAATLRNASIPSSDQVGGDNFNKAITLIKNVFYRHQIITPVYADKNNLEVCLLEHMGTSCEEDLSRDLLNLTRANRLGTITIGVQEDSNQRSDENTVIG